MSDAWADVIRQSAEGVDGAAREFAIERIRGLQLRDGEWLAVAILVEFGAKGGLTLWALRAALDLVSLSGDGE